MVATRKSSLRETMAQATGNDDKLATLERKRSQIEARIERERARNKQRQRKEDTRRKIIAGAIALEHAQIDGEFGIQLMRLISRHVKREEDRKLFGLE